MSNGTRTILLLMAMVLICFLFAGQSKSQIATTPNGLLWEYHVTQGFHTLNSSHLRQFGNEGWELVKVFEQQDKSGVSAVFKRPK